MRKIDEIEQEELFKDDANEVPPSDIIAYNELRSCADLVRMHESGKLEIKPDFQRDYVWKNSDMTRFIDSLIKQLPIPSMCFSLDYKTHKWQVIDGLQRISTIIKFLGKNQEDKALSDLEDIDPNIAGKLLSEFKKEDSPLHEYYERVENLTLPITVLRCDSSKANHATYLFTIFHRLNTGGLKLTNQEIRNCIYSGSLNNLLKDLNHDRDWKKLTRYKEDQKDRFAREELILRLFAFHDGYRTYGGRLASFLNNYMQTNRWMKKEELEKRESLFNDTVQLALYGVYNGKVPPKQPLAILESILIGISFNIDRLNKAPKPALANALDRLLSSEYFQGSKLVEGLSGKSRVVGRINDAIEAFRI